MKSILDEIKQLRLVSPFLINRENYNRYCVLLDETNGSQTGYYFSTPIYNIHSGKGVDIKFEQTTNHTCATGSNAVINVSKNILLENAVNSCSLVLDQDITRLTKSEVFYTNGIIRPTLNGVVCQIFLNKQSRVSFDFRLGKCMNLIRANNKCFSVMCQKFRPFVTVSCIGTLDESGKVIAPTEIAYQTIDELTYRLTFTPCIGDARSIIFEINLYEDKLFQDTTVESLNPQSNNAFGGTAFIGNTSSFGEQWLYSRLDFSKMSELMYKKINHAILHVPTSRTDEITDRCGNKTAYTYDAEGNTTSVTSKNASGTALADVSYTYDAWGNISEIARGDGMKYSLVYNSYHNLASIGINGKNEALISYGYKNEKGRLKNMTYANGDSMSASYNSMGQMVSETWSDADGVEKARYKYVYDGAGNLNRSIDIHAQKEYNYVYEDGKILCATELDITLSGELVTGRTLVNTIQYTYDSDGTLTSKTITPAGGSSFTYSYSGDNATFTVGSNTVTAYSSTDALGRKTYDGLQLGTGIISRGFAYHSGMVTEEHVTYGKQKSTATTQLVKKITFANGRTLEYEYDAEERITKVTDSEDGTTEYTYDALGQLLTEKVNGTVVTSMTYDNYGNILTKNGTAYTYDPTWKDLLTSYNGQSIIYDAQGNPTTYLGHTLTWEKGRQLKSFDNNTYT